MATDHLSLAASGSDEITLLWLDEVRADWDEFSPAFEQADEAVAWLKQAVETAE
jgi:hypothetical protein